MNSLTRIIAYPHSIHVIEPRIGAKHNYTTYKVTINRHLSDKDFTTLYRQLKRLVPSPHKLTLVTPASEAQND